LLSFVPTYTFKIKNGKTFNHRCGIVQAKARDAFAADGNDGMMEFSALSDRDIEQFVKNIN
jgi:hypothetical protein